MRSHGIIASLLLLVLLGTPLLMHAQAQQFSVPTRSLHLSLRAQRRQEARIKKRRNALPKLHSAAPSSCRDSDGGQNFYTRGLATRNGSVQLDAENTLDAVDKCTVMNGTSVLNEQYCEGDLIKHVIHECEKGCFNGACKQ